MQLQANRKLLVEPPEDLLVELNELEDLPSPPDIVTRIIELLRDPEADFTELMDILANDPVLVAKILKTANSAMYARRREVTNLAQALLTLGQTTAATLALSFSLVGSLNKRKTVGIDLSYYWKRSLLTATAAKAIGGALKSERKEELFLGGLLQDIGLLVLDKLLPDHFQNLGDQQKDHQIACRYEIDELGVDHAWIGSWLLEKWELPEIICDAVRYSHCTAAASADTERQLFLDSVNIAGEVADGLLSDQSDDKIAILALHMQEKLGLDERSTLRVISEVGHCIPNIESQFGMDILDTEAAATIVDHARKILTDVNLKARQEILKLHREIDSLGSKAQSLEDQNHTDKLTGLRNRNYMDAHLTKWVAQAKRGGFPLSLAFMDLDNFKAINDTYSHSTGDDIIKSTAALLRAQIRENDTLARYGGDEFILLLGGETGAHGRLVCDRIIKAFNESKHTVKGAEIALNISIGLATLEMTDSVGERDLIEAADAALKCAKQQGRGQVIEFCDI